MPAKSETPDCFRPGPNLSSYEISMGNLLVQVKVTEEPACPQTPQTVPYRKGTCGAGGIRTRTL
jgi:hypothetical protein